MITKVRFIAAKVCKGSEEIEIVAEIKEKNGPLGEKQRTKLVSAHFDSFNLFEFELQAFIDEGEKMICPECRIRHRTLEKAELCLNPIEGEEGNYIIMFSAHKDGPTKAGCEKAKVSWPNYQDIMKRKRAMLKYLKEKKEKRSARHESI